MTKEEIDLAGATNMAREFLRMMFGNLYLHSFCLEYAGIESLMDPNDNYVDNYIIRCRLTIPFTKGKTHYSFTISKQGLIKKMELIEDD